MAAAARLVAADEHVVGRVEEEDARRCTPMRCSSSSAAERSCEEVAGAHVDDERVARSASRCPRASSATLPISIGGRLSMTKKPRSSSTCAASERPAPDMPGDDRDVESGRCMVVIVRSWSRARGRGAGRTPRGPTASGSHGSASSSSSSSSRSFFTEPNSLQQPLLAGRAEAGDVVEHRRRHLLVAQLAVVRDREAVRLVAHLLQQVQRLRVARDAHRLGAARAGTPLRTAWRGSRRRCLRGRAPRARAPRR